MHRLHAKISEARVHFNTAYDATLFLVPSSINRFPGECLNASPFAESELRRKEIVSYVRSSAANAVHIDTHDPLSVGMVSWNQVTHRNDDEGLVRPHASIDCNGKRRGSGSI